MLGNITGLASTLTNIQKSLAGHSKNLANQTTPGYIAKIGIYQDNPKGYVPGASYVEVDQTNAARYSFSNMANTNASLQNTMMQSSMVDTGLQPLPDANPTLKKMISQWDPNNVSTFKDMLNAQLKDFQTIYANIGNTKNNATGIGLPDLTSQSKEQNITLGLTKQSSKEYQVIETNGKIDGINQGIGLLDGGSKALEQDFNNFKDDMNKIFGGNIITGSLNDAKIGTIGTPSPNPSFQDYSKNYELYRASKTNILSEQKDRYSTMLNQQTTEFQANFGVDVNKEVTQMAADQQTYNAVAKSITVQNEMLGTVIDLVK